MRRVLYSVAASLDGYIAGPKGEFDWIPRDTGVDWKAFMSRFDTVLMGRRTYEVAAGEGSGASTPDMRAYVFSRTLRGADHPKVKVVAQDATGTVGKLRRAPGKDIWLMGGGILFGSLLEAGLVDGIEVGLVPVLLGGGLPLMPPVSRRTRLALTGSRTHPSGIVMLTYDVVKDGAPRRGSGRARRRTPGGPR